MLVPSEDSNMESERPASAQRIEGVCFSWIRFHTSGIYAPGDCLLWLCRDWLHNDLRFLAALEKELSLSKPYSLVC